MHLQCPCFHAIRIVKKKQIKTYGIGWSISYITNLSLTLSFGSLEVHSLAGICNGTKWNQINAMFAYTFFQQVKTKIINHVNENQCIEFTVFLTYANMSWKFSLFNGTDGSLCLCFIFAKINNRSSGCWFFSTFTAKVRLNRAHNWFVDYMEFVWPSSIFFPVLNLSIELAVLNMQNSVTIENND